MKLRVELNGTDKNPYHKYGLSQNPFPQIASYETTKFCLQLQKLGGDPIPNVQYIKNTLKGFSQEFIDLCCAKFLPGQYVEFEAEFPD